MGQIQSSMNRITTLVSGAVAGGIKGYQRFNKPESTEEKKPQAETTNSMGNNVQLRPVKRSAHYAAVGQDAAQDAIQGKYFSAIWTVDERIKAAEMMSKMEIKDKLPGRLSKLSKEKIGVLKQDLASQIIKEKGESK